MNCWEVLGISPTKDQREIKKAYALAVTQHHPEDDPEGFQIVYHAFQQAIAYSKVKDGIPAEFFGDQSLLQISELTFNKSVASERKKESPEPQGLMYYTAEADANSQQEASNRAENSISETNHVFPPEPSRSESPEQSLPKNQVNEGAASERKEESSESQGLMYYTAEADANSQQETSNRAENSTSETNHVFPPEPAENENSEQLLQNNQGSEKTSEKPTASEQKKGYPKQLKLLGHKRLDIREEQYNFEDVIGRGKEIEEDRIASFLKTIDSIYHEKKVLKRLKKWKQCFSSNEFVLQRKSDEFISRFLSYLIDHGDLKPLEWTAIFAPMLRDMLYYYPTGVERQKILLLMRHRNKLGFITKKRKRSFASVILWFVVVWGIIFIICWSIPKNSKNTSNGISTPVYVSTPIHLEFKPLEKELMDVYEGITEGESYSSLSRECEDLDITQDDYNRMKSEYVRGDANTRDRIARELTGYYIEKIKQSSSGTSADIK
jgi:curved DNA-binding protein CbpA